MAKSLSTFKEVFAVLDGCLDGRFTDFSLWYRTYSGLCVCTRLDETLDLLSSLEVCDVFSIAYRDGNKLCTQFFMVSPDSTLSPISFGTYYKFSHKC